MPKTKKEKDLEEIEAFIGDSYGRPVMEFYEVFKMIRLFTKVSKDVTVNDVKAIELKIADKFAKRGSMPERRRIDKIKPDQKKGVAKLG